MTTRTPFLSTATRLFYLPSFWRLLFSSLRSTSSLHEFSQKYGLSTLCLIVAIYMDNRYPSLFSWFWHCNCVLCVQILFCGHCFPHFCGVLHNLFLVLAQTHSICNPNAQIYNGRHEEVSVHDCCQRRWTFGDSCFRCVVECQSRERLRQISSQWKRSE